jgi:hypothetical protein
MSARIQEGSLFVAAEPRSSRFVVAMPEPEPEAAVAPVGDLLVTDDRQASLASS